MNTFFHELGRTILERWKQENFSLVKFPELARVALDERPPATAVQVGEILQDFLLNDEQPPQTDSDFGEPEIIAYGHPRFYIQLLFWMDGTTAIHQHEFSGAFHVMHGSSIHAHYEFEKAQPITPYLRVGNLRLKDMELLETGRTVPIASGQGTIHSLFHLDSPSVTVVVRTQHDPGTGPQYIYLPPHVGFDPQFSDKLTMRRKQLLDMLEQTEDDGYLPLLLEMITDLDFERGFSILHHCRGYLQHLDAREPVLRAFEKRHGKLAAGIAATLDEDGRRSLIKGLRSTIVEPELRFFLALLMNAPTRDHLLALVGQRFPTETPVDVVIRWIEELIAVSDEGVMILDAMFPNTIDADLKVQPGLFVSAFRHFVSGGKKLPAIMRDLTAADVKELRKAFAGSALSVLIS